ncbi:hypothetical protein SK571_03650 [Lentzea sp. BCCO 10_0798]|uniref:Uncharacterized protein n=1 Tax=Lentzea kristufekii TaxID=3095430 RepID=A0ABU4TJS0_9PSEU|nr:hypothetical protein [Lentzea sp. BCCO 10_0798]MDX8048465.1 hypothetical protein [Lentzea sp. BCCO 10_0798]
MGTAELPAGGPFTERGTKQWKALHGGGEKIGPDVAPLTCSVKVEAASNFLAAQTASGTSSTAC